MVGKKSMTSCSDIPKRVIPELALANRPKRNISPKNLDNDTGLSWREERDLHRALYASLLESRRISREDEGGMTPSGIQDQDSRQSVSSRSSMPCQFDDGGSVSQDSFRSMASTAEEKKQIKAPLQKKIHAQRKFAQGSLPPTPSTTPLKPKFKTSPVKVFPQRPRTEDFLTYLCFRGTNILPAFLDLANPTARVESCPGELSQADTHSRMTRESSPTSSSTSMSQNGDSVDLPVLTPHSQTPTRRAARASAGTPETARGFAGLRSSVSKKSPSLSKTPLPKGRRFSGSTGQGRYSNGFYPPPPKLALAVGMKKSCGRAGVSDRLALKKKAMATLAAVRHSPKKPLVKKSPVSRRALSDSSLPRSQSVTRSKSASGILSQNKISRVSKIESTDQNGKGSSLRRSELGRVREKESATKRKSTSEHEEKFTGTTPPKKLKLRTSKRVKELIKKRDKVEGFSVEKKRIYAIEKDFHPLKKYATKPFSRTVRSKGPVTRASTHIRKALASAKKMASKKLKLLKQSCQNTEMPRLVSEREQQHQEKLTRLIKRKRTGIKKTHSSSTDNNLFRYQTIVSSLEGFKKEERRRSEGERVFKVELFPQPGDPAAIISCPVFYPTEEEFRDPFGYIQSIQATAEHYGMCKIVPPNSWKMESKVNEEVRFTSQIQYIHKLHHRWGPAAIKIECIKRRFEAASSEKFQLPHIGGTELDLVRLHKVIRSFGGVQNVIEKKKWVRVADTLKIPRQSQDRVTKLYDAYCKYLVPFDTLTQEEVQKLEQSVIADRMKQEKSKTLSETCTSRGRSQTMGAFSRTARNIQIMYGSDVQASPEQIEVDYWKLVEERTSHIAVQCCKLDTSIYSSMFPIKRDNPYSRHPWNLHNFVQVRSNLLHHLGLVADVTVPTLHVKMLYSTDCWSADNHYLPYIQYHHQGSDLIWYAVPEKEEDQFKSALREEVGSLLRNGGKWLPMDSVMVPPKLLLDKNVSLSRCVQHAGEFVVVFSKAYTANFSCGLALSESINFATQDWIPHGFQAALDLCASQDPEQFSMDAMLVFLARDPASSKSCLPLILPYLEQVVKKELEQRQQLIEAGLKSSERIQPKVTKTGHKTDILEEIHICDVSGKICYLSMVLNDAENSAFCLEQGLTHIQKKRNLKNCKLMYRFTETELKNLVRETKEKVGARDSKDFSKELRESTRELRESTREIRESVRETRESRASKEFTRDTRETREFKETNRETKESSRESRESRESKEILETACSNSPTSPKKKSLRKSESYLKPSVVEKT
ncbi:hypothetical protein CHS0354_042875 [Potamilus streckersoni]|uniref:Protein Jumonji n=1 Tax=Potamilus streckersoni TaxID=2493646 RepID=A0AAE0T4W3_9BIVA|nr:hypothetical protein CHS0354_042875 [Potamilus streckersoni]